ncbi:MAG: holo-ACP synthase [Eubacteriales bacterium]|nr:holo-ACP synthase [Eubacteriales bacterium]
MPVYCGVDIVEVKRIRGNLEINGEAFKNKVYTKNEIEYCESRKSGKYQSYAVRFAAKEAVSKAFGTGMGSNAGWKDIEITRDENGKPGVLLSGLAKKRFEGMDGVAISISLSHSKTYAVAYALLETK